MEIWDVYDRNRRKTGRTHKRGIPLEKGDYHLVVHVWIINDNGEILIQKRQPWKDKGNLWDCSAAGAAIIGDESKDAAIREVKEELGIDLDIKNESFIFSTKMHNAFEDIWLIKKNIKIEDLNLQYEEVSDAKWVKKEELMEMIASGEFIDRHYLNPLLERLSS